MTIGTLVHITAAKKLMIKISEKTYDMITARLTAACKKKNFPADRIAAYSRENDDGEEDHFVMISLDKYDKQNMRKFEQLLKKDVAIQYRMKPYDFVPNGEDEQRCGINLELISIRQVKPKITIEWDQKTPSKDEILEMAARAVGVTLIKDSEIDEQQEEKPTLPPKLERQTATGTSVATRRRRTPVATKQELTDVEEQVKYLDDLIAANERAIGVGSDMSDPDE